MLGNLAPKLRRLLMALAGPYVATIALAWLMVLLVLGTLAQANIGLFQAQQQYFYSLVLWLGFIPTPGGASTMGLLGLGLTLKLILHPWRLKQVGSLLAHMAVWLLLVGGFITALSSQEGYLQVAEGQSSNIMQSYHTPELAVLSASGTTLVKYPVSALVPSARLRMGEDVLVVEAYYPNSALTMRPKPLDDGLTRGARRFMAFTAKAPERDDERNRPTLLFTLQNSATVPLAKLVLFQHQPVPQPVRVAGHPSATLVLRPMQTELPFHVTLQRFEAEYYPGTNVARHYASAVAIASPQSGIWPAYIRMNAPLRYGGYTLYQASFIDAQTLAQADTTILAVVKNQGFLVPYVASILLCIGLLMHLLLRWRRTLPLVLVLPLLLPLTSHAEPPLTGLNMATFGQLPIQHQGRIKPLKSYAEVTLHTLSGQRGLPNLNATAWLAETVFTPQAAMQRPVFLLPSLALQERLKLPPRSPRRYSYTELVPALQPHFVTLQTLAAQPPAMRDALDTQLLTLAGQIQLFYVLTQTGQVSPTNALSPLTVHPPRLAEALWLTPVAAPPTPYRATWEAMALAYAQADTALWQTATQAAWRQAQNLPGVRPRALQAEVALRALRPFELATAVFALALLASLWRRAKKWAGPLLVLGLGISSMAIAARVYILQRPPVGTLYESVVFVCAICVLAALVAAYQKGGNAQRWLTIGAATGLLVQLLGLRYAASGGDTLGVLTAVLDTHFWLATHVLVITAGYGIALLAGAWAHGMLAVRAWRGRAFAGRAFGAAELRTLNVLLLAGLVLTATGTLLGGVWADQSWGRFWGWDPKENGALLLTLWLVWLLHARLAGIFKPLGLVVGTALTPCVVALAWFGVNLLGVGLHSYGFTQGTMLWLVGFIVLEILLISALAWSTKK